MVPCGSLGWGGICVTVCYRTACIPLYWRNTGFSVSPDYSVEIGSHSMIPLDNICSVLAYVVSVG